MSMFKAIVIGCAICAGAGATAYWVKSTNNAAAQASVGQRAQPAHADSSMRSVFQELHSKAHQDGLPVQVIEDPN
jgi:hypothetical protein